MGAKSVLVHGREVARHQSEVGWVTGQWSDSPC